MELKCKQDGSFKIIQVSDLHEIVVGSALTRDFLRGLAKTERPDLFVLTGDNISERLPAFGRERLRRRLIKRSIDAVMRVFDEIYRDHGIPVTMVLGNHDTEHSRVTREESFWMYAAHESFIGVAMPEADEGAMGASSHHFGTHNLLVKDKTGARPIFNLWMFDSGDYSNEGAARSYDGVRPPQIEWFRAKNAALDALPSLAFQHIIVPEILDFLTPEGMEGLNEAPCPGSFNYGQYAAMSEAGGVRALFVGHDHENSFQLLRDDGPDLVNTPTAGFGAYGKLPLRGVRVIELNEKDLSVYGTHVVTYQEYYAPGALRYARLALFEAPLGRTKLAANIIDAIAFRPVLGMGKLFQNIISKCHSK